MFAQIKDILLTEETQVELKAVVNLLSKLFVCTLILLIGVGVGVVKLSKYVVATTKEVYSQQVTVNESNNNVEVEDTKSIFDNVNDNDEHCNTDAFSEETDELNIIDITKREEDGGLIIEIIEDSNQETEVEVNETLAQIQDDEKINRLFHCVSEEVELLDDEEEYELSLSDKCYLHWQEHREELSKVYGSLKEFIEAVENFEVSVETL